MFNNPGGKIKGLAKVLFWLLLIFYIIGGIAMIIIGIDQDLIELTLGGVVTIGLGFLFAWLSVLFTYAFGSVVEDVEKIRKSIEQK